MRTLAIMWLAALAAGISAPALAQSTASPHQRGQPAAPAQTPQAGPHKGMQHGDGRCDCCEMMKEMMRMMHHHSGQPGMKIDMMQAPDSPPQGSAPPRAGQQQEDKPRH